MKPDTNAQFIYFTVVLNLIECVEYFSLFLIGDAYTVIGHGDYYLGILFYSRNTNRAFGIFQGIA